MPHKILVADDDILVLDALRELLVADGYEVTTATRGREALEAMERQRFDLVVLDVVMPKMTGFEVCRQIRAWDDERSRVKIVMLTAKTDPRDLEIGEEAGCDLYLTKPIDPGKLKELIRGALGDPPQKP
ncbi:MAG: two-component system response regulator [Deltaproteobacteria bacterium]|nr:response regulator [Deltaproteobacteria bacterium]MBW2078168.1 response regulator [Deltaproteobacteria bacterium]MBW2311902.1 response regulator [Deltaproteobacteria bacterium]RLB30849.1 MAG: two-component system response regulator [Deltaproteobacteria bacterium]